jgi:hypothetical protein
MGWEQEKRNMKEEKWSDAERYFPFTIPFVIPAKAGI